VDATAGRRAAALAWPSRRPFGGMLAVLECSKISKGKQDREKRQRLHRRAPDMRDLDHKPAAMLFAMMKQR
jgi:hypothetical protein